jgi:hypothetical protein
VLNVDHRAVVSRVERSEIPQVRADLVYQNPVADPVEGQPIR